MDLDDATLLARVGAGDASAFAAVVRRHQRAVVAVGFCVTGSRALAEELAQEAFVKAWRHSHEVREPDKLGAWLCGIVRALARDATRLEARRRALGLPDPLPPPATPRDDLDARQREAEVAEVLAELPESVREPLLLHYLDGRSLAQIARTLELSIDAVKQRVSRGRRALRDGLARRHLSERRFATTALALAPSVDFTRRVVTTATGQTPPAPESFMHAHAWKFLGLTAAIATSGGIALAVTTTRSDDATAGPSTASPASAPHSTAAPSTTAASAAAIARRRFAADRLAAIRAARALAPGSGVAPDTMTYDFAGKRLQASAEATTASASASPPSPQLDKAGLRAAITAIEPQLRACYGAALARDPAAAGTLELALVIEGTAGEPAVLADATIGELTTLVDPAFGACVLDAAFELEFPVAGRDVTLHVRYPYELVP